MATELDFGTIPKAPGATLKPTVSFAADLALAGSGTTLAGTPTVSGSGVTATYVSHTAAGAVTFTVSGGTEDTVGVVTITATYSNTPNGETQVGFLYVTPG